jgi:exodeoxyribonuclease VII large subunit
MKSPAVPGAFSVFPNLSTPMGKIAQTQWDFGEVIPEAPASRRVLTVSELTGNIRRLLETQIGQVWVSGEVTNLRVQGSGHVYFTIKDASAQLQCVLFRSETVAHRELLQDGQKLLLQGDVSVYETRGQYQLIVRAIELQGLGALQIAFEKLKRKLQAEGLFAQERKRALPKYPQHIGLVTSETGAAIRDVLHVIQRRQPSLQITLASCRVQGPGAAMEIARAIQLLNEWCGLAPSHGVDLILVTRGGGSLEDLWAFNEEVVARAIFNSALPVVSGVGHEIDITISDFVADVRAATPSAAAEIITEGTHGSRAFVADTAAYLRQLLRRRLEGDQEWLGSLRQRLLRLHPRQHVREQMQWVDDLQARMIRCVRQTGRDCTISVRNLRQRLVQTKPSILLLQLRRTIRDLNRRLHELAGSHLKGERAAVKALCGRLQLLSPQNVLGRGYSITSDAETGKILRNVRDARRGQNLKTQLKEGTVRSIVAE